jgi:hypothetical protein
MRKMCFSPLIALVLLLALTACSGGGGTTTTTTTTPTPTTPPVVSTPTTPNATSPTAPIPPTPPAAPVNNAVVLTGIFVDAPVAGLTFTSGAQPAGLTDASGTFRFEQGGTVQFQVGNVVLGRAPGKALMTPLDLVKAVDATATVADPRVTQITQFLMTVNSSATATQMTIPGAVVTAAQGVATVDLSQAPLDIAPIIAAVAPAKTPVTTAVAAAHIQGTVAALTAPKTGTFAAVDSMAAPKLGIRLSVVPNLVGNAFDVTGVAANTQGDAWTIAGTMTLDGSMQATGTGTGAAPPAAMTITGAMTSATQITAAASFTSPLSQVPLLFEKATTPLVTGKFGLSADPGVTNATQIQHVAADLTILADGQVSAHLVEGEVTGLPLAAVLGGRFAALSGVVTSTGSIIAFGGTPGAGETTISRSTTAPTPVAFFTGTLDPVAATASVKATVLDITGGGLTVPQLGFVKATNAFAGVYAGSHSDTAPNPPGTVAFGVNNDGSVHGFTRFLSPGKRFPESDFLLDGVVSVAGVLGIPPTFAVGNLGAINGNPGVPGIVMTDDEGISFGAFVGTFGGTIDATGAIGNGAWTTGPVIASGTFSVNVVP